MTISKFAGFYNATSFAYGCAGSDAPPLQVISGSTSTGAYTLTCQPTQSRTSSGLAIPTYSGSTYAPITIGGDSGIETVTPTAVSTNSLNQVLITATFTYAHSTGAQVSSGSFGIQEAIFACSAGGGGQVVVDGQWVRNGGTTSTLNAAVFLTGVGLFDNRYGDSLSGVTTTLTSTQILNMATTAVELLPAPNSLQYWQVNSAALVALGGATAYAAGSTMYIAYGTATTTTAVGTIAATFLSTATTAQVVQVSTGLTAITSSTAVLGKGVYILNPTTSFTTGTGQLQITLDAALITT
jgi:hypothetical protein